MNWLLSRRQMRAEIDQLRAQLLDEQRKLARVTTPLLMGIGTYGADGEYHEADYPGYERERVTFWVDGYMAKSASHVMFYRGSSFPACAVTHASVHFGGGPALAIGPVDLSMNTLYWQDLRIGAGEFTVKFSKPVPADTLVTP